MKLLLIGLGNLGSNYTYTRHNMGFLVIDHLAKQQQLSFQRNHLAYIASFALLLHEVYMVKPTTYMNESGQAVVYWLNRLHIPTEQSLTIVDDIALPFGGMRLRSKGSDGGHNGLKSIHTQLGSNSYPRLRIGIGHNFPKGKLADFVLSNFLPAESTMLPDQLDRAVQMITAWCNEKIVAKSPLPTTLPKGG